jgi:hypothetical protein
MTQTQKKQVVISARALWVLVAVGLLVAVVGIAALLSAGSGGDSSPRTTEEWCADKSRDEDLQIVTDMNEATLYDDCVLAVESFGRQFTNASYEEFKEDKG